MDGTTTPRAQMEELGGVHDREQDEDAVAAVVQTWEAEAPFTMTVEECDGVLAWLHEQYPAQFPAAAASPPPPPAPTGFEAMRAAFARAGRGDPVPYRLCAEEGRTAYLLGEGSITDARCFRQHTSSTTGRRETYAVPNGYKVAFITARNAWTMTVVFVPDASRPVFFVRALRGDGTETALGDSTRLFSSATEALTTAVSGAEGPGAVGARAPGGRAILALYGANTQTHLRRYFARIHAAQLAVPRSAQPALVREIHAWIDDGAGV